MYLLQMLHDMGERIYFISIYLLYTVSTYLNSIISVIEQWIYNKYLEPWMMSLYTDFLKIFFLNTTLAKDFNLILSTLTSVSQLSITEA